MESIRAENFREYSFGLHFPVEPVIGAIAGMIIGLFSTLTALFAVSASMGMVGTLATILVCTPVVLLPIVGVVIGIAVSVFCSIKHEDPIPEEIYDALKNAKVGAGKYSVIGYHEDEDEHAVACARRMTEMEVILRKNHSIESMELHFNVANNEKATLRITSCMGIWTGDNYNVSSRNIAFKDRDLLQLHSDLRHRLEKVVKIIKYLEFQPIQDDPGLFTKGAINP